MSENIKQNDAIEQLIAWANGGEVDIHQVVLNYMRYDNANDMGLQVISALDLLRRCVTPLTQEQLHNVEHALNDIVGCDIRRFREPVAINPTQRDMCYTLISYAHSARTKLSLDERTRLHDYLATDASLKFALLRGCFASLTTDEYDKINRAITGLIMRPMTAPTPSTAPTRKR